VDDRFWSKVYKYGVGGCWYWLAGLSIDGYGRFSIGHTTVKAHRYAYEALGSPIPDGLQLDHLCRVRHYVNPAHLEPVTGRTNVLRGPDVPGARSQDPVPGRSRVHDREHVSLPQRAAGLPHLHPKKKGSGGPVMTATDRDKYRLLTTLAVLLVASIAAVVSYIHVAALAIRYGQPPVAAYLLPISVDGLVATSSSWSSSPSTCPAGQPRRGFY